MKTTATALVLIVLGCPTAVMAQMDCDDRYENLHWSQDGRFLTYKKVTGSSEGAIDTNDVVVYDLAAGKKSEQFVVAAEAHCWDGGSGECDRQLRRDARKAKKMVKDGKEGWRLWASKNALVKATKRSRSPDKKSTASFWIAPSDDGIDAVTAIRRGRQYYVCRRAALFGDLKAWLELIEYSDDELAVFYWSPNGQYVAMTIHVGDCYGQSLVSMCSVAKATQKAATVEIRKVGSYGEDAPALVDILAKNGFGLVRLMQAQSPRERTTIYTKQASSAQARKLAKIVPGGADVEKLTWSSNADFVLALGASFFDAE